MQTRLLLYRLAGLAIVISCVVGIIFSLSGIVYIWSVKPRLTERVETGLKSFDKALEITNQGLSLAESALGTTISSLSFLQKAVEATARTVDATAPAMDSLVKLTEIDLPSAINTAQTSLKSAQDGARVIDGVLRALSALPIVNYDPKVPLYEALENVSKSLDNMPQTFTNMKDGLAATRDNLQSVQADIETMAVNIQEIKNSLGESQAVIDGYQELISLLQQRVAAVLTHLSLWMNVLGVFLSGFFAWLILIQLGVLMLGVDFLEKN